MIHQLRLIEGQDYEPLVVVTTVEPFVPDENATRLLAWLYAGIDGRTFDVLADFLGRDRAEFALLCSRAYSAVEEGKSL